MSLVKRFLAPSDFTDAESWRLVEWCRTTGASEFTIDCLAPDTHSDAKVWAPFERLVAPFARGEHRRERMSGPTADQLTRDTSLWTLNDVTIGALKAALPMGLFGYDPSERGWFEDPILYRQGELMLGVLSHEAFAVLRITEKESQELATLGFKSHDLLPRVS